MDEAMFEAISDDLTSVLDELARVARRKNHDVKECNCGNCQAFRKIRQAANLIFCTEN